MNEQENVVELLQDIKGLLSHSKKVLNINDLVKYTGLSKSKIYKLSQLKLIPTGKNKHIRQLFFSKAEIDEWLLGEPNLSDEFLELQFNKQMLRNRKSGL
ncbi:MULTISPECIES: helix-turn-helix transcriptional regulator [Winogradskyella]|uniref:AlpA family transcriptional regulator n=1 Tax=Winogradskyella pacifica TaxID=664642 RepID=A0A3D9LMA6_9FLAO|nr:MULTISPECIES: helix-turn-helix domain-containing protein [Winogradskyella]REE08529.1 AlpA family transcriptional regulator [Winogradskyella pacifica]